MLTRLIARSDVAREDSAEYDAHGGTGDEYRDAEYAYDWGYESKREGQ